MEEKTIKIDVTCVACEEDIPRPSDCDMFSFRLGIPMHKQCVLIALQVLEATEPMRRALKMEADAQFAEDLLTRLEEELARRNDQEAPVVPTSDEDLSWL